MGTRFAEGPLETFVLMYIVLCIFEGRCGIFAGAMYRILRINHLALQLRAQWPNHLVHAMLLFRTEPLRHIPKLEDSEMSPPPDILNNLSIDTAIRCISGGARSLKAWSFVFQPHEAQTRQWQ